MLAELIFLIIHLVKIMAKDNVFVLGFDSLIVGLGC